MEKFKIIEGANPNYLATICKIENLEPVPDSDHLMKTVINGYDIVVTNDMHIGDIVVYAPVESALSKEFLGKNNLFEIGCYDLNSNAEDVLELKIKMQKETDEDEKKRLEKEIKANVGFFNKHGRVRIVKLRKMPSVGFVTPVSSLVKFIPSLENEDWEALVGTSFSHIGEIEFIHKYIPKLPQVNPASSGKERRRNKKLQRFDRIIEDKFSFHYDTQMLNNNMWKLKPDDIVTISVKVHGTSAIFANILCNRQLNLWEKIKKFFGCKVKLTEYDHIYSSRSVIKNRYINKDAHDFYGKDVWGYVNDFISPYIDKDMTVYGEIAGFVPDTDKWIQKNHDYGCEIGQCKFMPYRITTENPDGTKYEWNVSEVYDWTDNLLKQHPELSDRMMNLNILYHGRFGDLYPDISETEHWHENVLARMKNDKEHFLMEEDEPMCTFYNAQEEKAKAELQSAKDNKMSKADIKVFEKKLKAVQDLKAPREGIVIRIDNDPISEAFKLKTLRHYGKEAEQHDNGEVDMEEDA